ncbi:MAG: radical SAM protein [Bdellovibrionales bacterium]|nr:radical SAM protein [Bdellovibrionales bacterium]
MDQKSKCVGEPNFAGNSHADRVSCGGEISHAEDDHVEERHVEENFERQRACSGRKQSERELLLPVARRAHRRVAFSSAGSVSQVATDSARQNASSKAAAPEQSGKSPSRRETSGDPGSPESNGTWFAGAEHVLCVNSYPNGITVSVHSGNLGSGHLGTELDGSVSVSQKSGAVEGGVDSQPGEERSHHSRYLAEHFALRVREIRDYQVPEGKYFVYKQDPRAALERHFARLYKRGVFEGATVFFGTTADPFAAFHRRFDITTACLQLFEQFRPRRLVVQTRSPMVIAALPTLKLLGERAVVGIPVESHLERSIAHYTPGEPRIAERLVAAQGLRRQGIVVNLQVMPVLPYGDLQRDAWDFAEVLERHADFITLSALASGTADDEKVLKDLPMARKLAADNQFRWLRPQAYKYVYEALKTLAPQKVKVPPVVRSRSGQLGLFAA